jgi:hypothetical protein
MAQAFDKFVAILKKRIASGPAVAKPLHDQVTALKQEDMSTKAQTLLNSIPAAGGPTGSCTYQIDGHNFCLEGLTQAECNDLSGGWQENGHCAISPWPNS